MRTVIFKMFDYKVWPVSDMLDSCKKVQMPRLFFALLAVLSVYLIQSIIVQIESVPH